jgi:hemolysin activation/secretion protein
MTWFHHRLGCGSVFGSAVIVLVQLLGFSAGAQNVLPGAEKIQGILVVPGKPGATNAEELISNVNGQGVTGIHGVVVRGPDFLRAPDFQSMLSKYLGKPLTSGPNGTLAEMQRDIIRYCRAKGHLVVDVFYPEQDIQENTIQIVVIEGRIGKIRVDNPGHKWFSDSIILRNVSLKPGDTVTSEALNRDLSWLNRNSYQSLGFDGFSAPFRDVTASFTQGDLGETDVNLNVQDRFPLRPYIGYDDAGFTVIGEDQFFAGVNWANAWGLDHRINFQFTSDTDFDKFKSYAGSYTIPLPWRHEIVFFGAYADLRPDLSQLNNTNFSTLNNNGSAWQTSVRYLIPLPRIGTNFDHTLSAGFDFKRTDSPLFFNQAGGNSLQLLTNEIDVAQFTLDYSGQLRDKYGATAFSVGGVYSPGDLTDYNKDSTYNEFAVGAKANYGYARGELRRETLLPGRFSLYNRLAGQYSPDKLVPSETFGLGGFATVRGYNERVVNGDGGVLVTTELRTPPLIISNITRKENARDWIMGLVFLDYGWSYTDKTAAGFRSSYNLLSIGGGVRFEIADNLRIRFDYGFQLKRDYVNSPSASLENQPENRMHLGAELSF